MYAMVGRTASIGIVEITGSVLTACAVLRAAELRADRAGWIASTLEIAEKHPA
jgi:hypothetical protein